MAKSSGSQTPMSNHTECCLCLGRRDRKCNVRCLLCILGSVGILAFVGGVVALTLAFGPVHHVEANVEDARLNRFDLATTYSPNGSSSFFAYNISVAVAVRNTNWGMSINYTEALVASIVFQDRRLYNVTVAEEGSKHSPRRTKLHNLQVARDQVPSYVFGTQAVEEFKKQNATGAFQLEVLFSGEIKYMGFASAFSDKREKLGLTCPLGLQLAPPGAEVIVFREVNCNLDKREKIYY